MNYIDLLIFVVFGYYVWQGYQQGLVHLLVELLALILSLVAALFLYTHVGAIFSKLFNISPVWADPLGFFTTWFVVESVFFAISHYIIPKFATSFIGSKKDKLFSVVPALLKALVTASIFLSFFVALPLKSPLKKDILRSYLGAPLVRATDKINGLLNNVFGGAIKQTLNFITIRQPGSGETYDLGFKTNDFIEDEGAEKRMLDLVNNERSKAGLKPLVLDTTIRAVARLHSEDMLRKGYFAHTNKDRKTPCQRMTEGGVSYTTCGENLAYAPDVDVAHDGLMNSPGHRANILSPDYGRIGIGVIDAGPYGEMFTQNFAN